MAYYHDLITQQSFAELIKLKQIVDFVLIGGWAVYFYTKSLKSKDIDILINYDDLPRLASHYSLAKNERLKKYEARRAEIHIDVYVPYYSHLGIPVESLLKQTHNQEGFKLLEANYLTVLKMYTFSQRANSIKGRKDFLDILALLRSDVVALPKITELVSGYGLMPAYKVFSSTLKVTTKIPELNLNQHQLAKLKKTVILQSK